MSPTPRTTAASAGHLLELIRLRGGLSRQQLLAETGMSRGTLYGRLDALARLGLRLRGGEPRRHRRPAGPADPVRRSRPGAAGRRPGPDARPDRRHRPARHRAAPRGAAAGRGRRRRRSCSVRSSSTRRSCWPAGAAERLVGLGVGVPAPVDPTSGRHRAGDLAGLVVGRGGRRVRAALAGADRGGERRQGGGGGGVAQSRRDPRLRQAGHRAGLRDRGRRRGAARRPRVRRGHRPRARRGAGGPSRCAAAAGWVAWPRTARVARCWAGWRPRRSTRWTGWSPRPGRATRRCWPSWAPRPTCWAPRWRPR